MSLKYRWSISRGLTLIEILVALSMTLIVLGAMMYAFRYASQEITRGRAVMELSNQLLVVQDLLRSDLDGVTVDVRPWSKTAGPNGYFEYIEGIGTDKSRLDFDGDNVVDVVHPDAVMGDVDDIVAMTVRSRARPFRGRWFDGTNTTIIESNVAEVIWWTTFVDLPDPTTGVPNGWADFNEPVTLHRRVLLVRPDLIVNTAALAVSNANDVQQFFLLNDVSARTVDLDADPDIDAMIPNSLADLSKRENRFCHLDTSYPFPLQRGLLTAFEMSRANMDAVNLATGTLYAADPGMITHAGDDIVMSDIVGFDLQIFSPDTPIMAAAADGMVMEPDDVPYNNVAIVKAPIETGAFVDLAYNRVAAPVFDPSAPMFSTMPTTPMALTDTSVPPVVYDVFYDTFSTHYESNGSDDDGDTFTDEGTDGIDNDGINGVDDNGERETLPPYPGRALGFKAVIRIAERNTKQVRQTEVISSFVPQ